MDSEPLWEASYGISLERICYEGHNQEFMDGQRLRWNVSNAMEDLEIRVADIDKFC